MAWIIAAIILLLAYLTFGSPTERPKDLRLAWMLLVGVLGVQALESFMSLFIDGSGSFEVVLVLQAISWGMLAFLVFRLVASTASLTPAVSAAPVPTSPAAPEPPGPPPASGAF